MMTRSIYSALYCVLTCFVGKLVLSDQRCRRAPNWLVNGRNPIIEAAADGNVVVMSLVSSKSRKFLLHTLDALNNYGRHYSYVVQQKVKIIVINGQGDKIPPSMIEYFQHIKIYDEPDNVDLFKKLRGNAWDVLVYDICGRMQFRYVYPYSWLGFPFLSRAINYAIGKYEHVCGKCTPLSHYRQMPAKIPPTLSSSHIPAEVVTITGNRQPTKDVSKPTTTKDVSKPTTTTEPPKAVVVEDESAGPEQSDEPKRAHMNPIFNNKVGTRMKPGSLATAVTATAPKKPAAHDNDIRKYIVSKLDKFLNTRHSSVEPTTHSVAVGTITTEDNSVLESGENARSEPTTDAHSETSENTIDWTPQNVLAKTELYEESTPHTTTPKPQTTDTSEEEDLNVEIVEEDQRLHHRIEQSQFVLDFILENALSPRA